MLMLIFAVGIAGVTTYIWCLRGFFSALIHMVCVLAAGAVAFGVWEPVSYALMGAMPTSGFFGGLGDMAWGLGLALPFALALAILRGIVDSLLPANAQCETVVDYIGGGVCGVVSGVISAGVVVLSIQGLRLEPDFGGYQSVVFTSGTGRGSLERTSETFVPWADRLTAEFYSHLSLTTLRTPDPMARWHPDLETFLGSMRVTYDGKSRTTFRPDAFTLQNWYTVGDWQKGEKFETLLSDAWSETPQKISDLRGRAFGSGGDDELRTGYLAGFTLEFNSKAREKAGQVVVGNGQVRLVVVNGDDDDQSLALQPIAVVTNIDDPTKIAYARFRFSGDNTYPSSVGGASKSVMAFEFPVPAGYKPLALYVKGVRVDLSEKEAPSAKYGSPAERDEAIQSGQMASMTDVGAIIDPNTGKPVQAPQGATQDLIPIVVSNALRGFTIQKSQEGSLEVEMEGKTWSVVRGDEKISAAKIKAFGGAGLDAKLKVDKLMADPSTAVVQVVVTPSQQTTEFNKLWEAADPNAEPALVDTNGTRYPASGWFYKDSTKYWVHYDRGSPLTKLSEVPTISRSATDRELTLIFVVSAGVQITDFKIGETALITPKKPIKAESTSRR